MFVATVPGAFQGRYEFVIGLPRNSIKRKGGPKLTGLHSGNLDQLQHVEPPDVEKESVMPKRFAQLRGCRMIVGRNLCSCPELRQGPAYLGVV